MKDNVAKVASEKLLALLPLSLPTNQVVLNIGSIEKPNILNNFCPFRRLSNVPFAINGRLHRWSSQFVDRITSRPPPMETLFEEDKVAEKPTETKAADEAQSNKHKRHWMLSANGWTKSPCNSYHSRKISNPLTIRMNIRSCSFYSFFFPLILFSLQMLIYFGYEL